MTTTSNYEIHYNYDDDSSEVLHKARITLTDAINCFLLELRKTLICAAPPMLKSMSLHFENKSKILEVNVNTEFLVYL